MRLPDEYTGNKFKPDISTYIDAPEFQHWEHTTSLIFDDVGFVDDGINGSVYGVVVGDSFTEGVGAALDDKWVEVLERNTGKDFVNMGFGAFSTTQAVRAFDKWGAEIHPKVVVYQFNPTDIAEDTEFSEWLGAGSPGYYREFQPRKKPFFELKRFLVSNLMSYQFLSILSRSDSNQFVYTNQNLTLSLNHGADFSTEKYRNGFETAKDSLLLMKKRAEEGGVEMIIVMIPLREQLYYHLESEAVRENIFWPQTAMTEFCEENSVRCYDTTPDFDSHKGEQIYWTYDGHFNKRGYQLLAEFTQKYLEKDNLLSFS